MDVQYRKLHQVRRIEHHVGVFLVRIDPLLLSAAHVRPLVDGLPGRESPAVEIADDPSQQPVVAGRHPVVVVERDARERGDENLEGTLLRDLRNQLRIERVDAFDQQHAARFHLQMLAVVLAPPRHEIEFRHVHHLAVEQFDHVLLQGTVVHRFEIVEIVAAVRQFRRLDAVHEIVVRREGDGLQPAGLELYAEAPRDRRLSTAGRPGDQHDAHRMHGVVVAALDLLGNLHEFLLLQCFGNLDQVGSTSFQADVVHVAGVAQVHDPVPLEVLREHLEGLGLVHEGGEPFRMDAVRYAQQDAVVIGNDVPHLDVACGRQQTPVIIVYRVAQHVIVHVWLSAGLQQPHLVFITLLAEDLDGLLQAHFPAMERQVLVDDLLHPGLDPQHVFFRGGGTVRLVQFTEIAVRDRMLDLHLCLRAYVQRSFAQQETERSAIDASCARIAQVQVFYVPVVVHAETQSLRHVVHLGGDDGIRAVELECGQHFLQRGAFVETLRGTGILAIDGKHGGRVLWVRKVSG